MAMYPIEACDLDLGKVVVGDDIYIHIRTANGEVAADLEDNFSCIFLVFYV